MQLKKYDIFTRVNIQFFSVAKTQTNVYEINYSIMYTVLNCSIIIIVDFNTE